MNIYKLLFLILWTPAVCHAQGNLTKPEIVLQLGQQVTASNKAGAVTVTAGKSFQRIVTWDGVTWKIHCEPRTERWNGSLGIVNSDETVDPPHQGYSRIVFEEGIQSFPSVAAAMKWLRQPYMQNIYDVSYNDTGLAVCWGKTPHRSQLNLEVWQILIDGKPPTRLEGARNEAITLTTKDKKQRTR